MSLSCMDLSPNNSGMFKQVMGVRLLTYRLLVSVVPLLQFMAPASTFMQPGCIAGKSAWPKQSYLHSAKKSIRDSNCQPSSSQLRNVPVVLHPLQSELLPPLHQMDWNLFSQSLVLCLFGLCLSGSKWTSPLLLPGTWRPWKHISRTYQPDQPHRFCERADRTSDPQRHYSFDPAHVMRNAQIVGPLRLKLCRRLILRPRATWNCHRPCQCNLWWGGRRTCCCGGRTGRGVAFLISATFISFKLQACQIVFPRRRRMLQRTWACQLNQFEFQKLSQAPGLWGGR